MNTRSKTFEWRGITVTVHPETVRSRVYVSLMASRWVGAQGFEDPGDVDEMEWLLVHRFMAFCARSTVSKAVAWHITASASGDEIDAACNAFYEQEAELYDLMVDATNNTAIEKKEVLTTQPTT